MYSYRHKTQKISIFIFILSSASFLLIHEPTLAQIDNKAASLEKISPEEEAKLTELQKQARAYHYEGFEAQKRGDLDAAISFYQKAVQLDPSYAAGLNDLAIVYEATGNLEQAEEAYLKAVKVDPNFLSAYSNLGFLYEIKRDLNSAALYWGKRAELGSPLDPWTQKAKQRLYDIQMVQGVVDPREQDVVSLMDNVLAEKALMRGDNSQLAKIYFRRAKASYDRGDELNALKQAISARQLDSSNTEIEEFVDKVQARLLSK